MKIAKISIMVACLATNIAFLYFKWKISILTVVLAFVFFCFAFIFQGAIHEVGHFVGGKMSGYKLVFLQIGRGNIICNRAGRFSLSIRKTHGGQCVMLPVEKKSIRYIAYNAGGVIFNALIALSSAALLFVNLPITTLIFIELFFSGFLKVVTNLIPSITNGAPTDGYILKLLRRKPLIQRDYAKYLSLYAAVFWKEKISIEDYTYIREPVDHEDELLFYMAVCELLNGLV